MSTIFTSIINREIPGHFVYEDEVCIAILDKFPAIEGQTLVIPKAEVDYLFDLPKDTYQHLLSVAKDTARALDTVFETERTCVIVEGFEVPHAHVKLYPMPRGTRSLRDAIVPGVEASDERLAELAEQIKIAIGTVR